MKMIERLDEKVRGKLYSQAGLLVTLGILLLHVAMVTWGNGVCGVYIGAGSFFFVWAVVWMVFALLPRVRKGVEKFADCFLIELIAPPLSAVLIYNNYFDKIDNSYPIFFFFMVGTVWLLLLVVGLLLERRRHKFGTNHFKNKDEVRNNKKR